MDGRRVLRFLGLVAPPREPLFPPRVAALCLLALLTAAGLMVAAVVLDPDETPAAVTALLYIVGLTGIVGLLVWSTRRRRQQRRRSSAH